MAREIVRDPIYMQVTEALLELVRSEFGIGDRFLTERQVSERFGISRTTANKALSNLVIDGVLEFRTGVGTFVRPPKPNVNLRTLVSFTEKARTAGLVPETVVLAFRRVQLKRVGLVPAAEVLAVLELDERAPVYEMERVRSLNGATVIDERRVLRADLCPDLGRDEVSGSLYTLFHDRYGLRLEGVAQRIRARNLDGVRADLLGVPEGTAVLELTGAGYLTDGTPLWYEETLYRGDTYEFVNTVRQSGEGPQSTLDPRAPAAQLWYRWQ